MPELPEVEVVRRGLAEHVTDDVIRRDRETGDNFDEAVHLALGSAGSLTLEIPSAQVRSDQLAAAGIEPVDQHANEFIEKAALAWFNGYRARIASGEIVHRDRGDAAIRQGAFTAAAEAA